MNVGDTAQIRLRYDGDREEVVLNNQIYTGIKLSAISLPEKIPKSNFGIANL